MLLQFGSMGQISHTQKDGHSPRRVDCSFLASLVTSGRLSEVDSFEVAHDLAYK